jgi:hypothetical protein
MRPAKTGELGGAYGGQDRVSPIDDVQAGWCPRRGSSRRRAAHRQPWHRKGAGRACGDDAPGRKVVDRGWCVGHLGLKGTAGGVSATLASKGQRMHGGSAASASKKGSACTRGRRMVTTPPAASGPMFSAGTKSTSGHTPASGNAPAGCNRQRAVQPRSREGAEHARGGGGASGAYGGKQSTACSAINALRFICSHSLELEKGQCMDGGSAALATKRGTRTRGDDAR